MTGIRKHQAVMQMIAEIETQLIAAAVVVGILVTLITILIATQLQPLTEAPLPETQYIAHTVQLGDTLWDISVKYRPNEDPRRVIWEIQADNGVGALIRPGDIIRVRKPAF